MELPEILDRVVEELTEAIPMDVADDIRLEIARIVNQGLEEATHVTHRGMREVAFDHHSSDHDLAHRLAEMLDRQRDMLVENLKSMR